MTQLSFFLKIVFFLYTCIDDRVHIVAKRNYN